MAITSLVGGAEADFTKGVNTNKNLDKNAFLTLLVTQMQNQDPLNPTEDKEFLAQLAQFTSLEQLTNLNTSMDKMVEVTNRGQLFSAVSYIGKYVSAPGNTVKLEDTGTASTVYYATDAPTTGGHINIFDTDGNIVYTEVLQPKTSGTYTFEWNGKDSDGNKMPAGYYGVSIGLEDSDGKSVLATTAIDGKVSGVESIEGEYYLTLDDGRVMQFSSVTFVSNDKIKKDPVTTPESNSGNNSENNNSENNA